MAAPYSVGVGIVTMEVERKDSELFRVDSLTVRSTGEHGTEAARTSTTAPSRREPLWPSSHGVRSGIFVT